MKIHYKGMVITQQYQQANRTEDWPFGRDYGYMGYGIVGLCLPELKSVADAKRMIDNYVAGKILI